MLIILNATVENLNTWVTWHSMRCAGDLAQHTVCRWPGTACGVQVAWHSIRSAGDLAPPTYGVQVAWHSIRCAGGLAQHTECRWPGTPHNVLNSILCAVQFFSTVEHAVLQIRTPTTNQCTVYSHLPRVMGYGGGRGEWGGGCVHTWLAQIIQNTYFSEPWTTDRTVKLFLIQLIYSL
jgi:hypothetical protein